MNDVELSSPMIAGRADSLWATIGRNVAAFTAGYFLEIAGELAPAARSGLDRLDANLGGNWPREIERLYGMRRAFAQDLYASLTGHFPPLEAIGFILRGLRVPMPAALIREFVACPDGTHAAVRRAASQIASRRTR